MDERSIPVIRGARVEWAEVDEDGLPTLIVMDDTGAERALEVDQPDEVEGLSPGDLVAIRRAPVAGVIGAYVWVLFGTFEVSHA